MDSLKNDEMHQAVRQQYGRVAGSGGARCRCSPPSCVPPTASAETLSRGLGYCPDLIRAVPRGANMGLGCYHLP